MQEEEQRFTDRRAASRMEADESDERRAEPAKSQDAAEDGTQPETEDAVDETKTNDEETLESVKAKAESYYANWQRSAADFINYKRRVEEERAETARLANAALAINLLPVYDDLERAIETVDASLAGLNWVQGIEAIYRKFGRLLESMNVHQIEAEGKDFDPSFHEAVGRQPGPEGQVLHVVQRGYRLGDRVIRPAMVIVGTGEAAPEQE